MKKFLSIIITLLVLIAAFIFGYFYRNTTQPFSDFKGLKVVASFYPLAEFSRNVGGAYAQVVTIVPPGAEPHEYQPTPKELLKANAADIFIFQGSGIDPWAEKIRPDLEKKGVMVLEMSKDGDPHTWIDPVLVQNQVAVLRDAFKKLDSQNAPAYDLNAQQYIQKLQQLDQEIRTKLSACSIPDVIVTHDAFGYFARRYGLKFYSITGLSPQSEPSSRHVAQLIEFARSRKIGVIFFETLVSPKLAQTIANEVGAKTLVLNPLENLTFSEFSRAENYISLMKENLHNLLVAYECAQ